MLSIWRFYTTFWIFQLWRINSSFVASWRNTRTKFLVSPKPLIFSRKILMLQQKYLRTIVESPKWNLTLLDNCTVLMSHCYSQLIKIVWIVYVHSITWYELETCVTGYRYQIKLIDGTIKLAISLDFWSMNYI